MNRFKLVFLTFVLGFAFSSQASLNQDDYINILSDQKVCLKRITKHLIEKDKARINILIEEIEKLNEIIDEKGINHCTVRDEFYTYYIKFRYSNDLLEIEHPDVICAKNVFSQIVEDRGLNIKPFLNFIESVFVDIKDKFFAIKRSDIPAELRTYLFTGKNDILVDLAKVIVAAKVNDDTEKTFKEAKRFYLKWVGHVKAPVGRPLYQELEDSLTQTKLAGTYWQIMGLLEVCSGGFDFSEL